MGATRNSATRTSATGNNIEKPSGRTRATRSAGIVLALVTTGAVVAACSSTPKAATAKPGCGGSASKLTVEGTGLASATPDLLTVAVDINVTDPTAKTALADDNTKAQAVINALGLGGLKPKDVQTSNVTIFPQYNIHGAITGYNVSNTLTAKLHDFTTAGAVIDAVAGAAGNSTRIDSLNFSVEDTRNLEDRARNDAVRQAVSHAKSMAVAANERLGPVCSLSDQSQTQPLENQNFSNKAALPAGDSAAAIPLEPGSQQESAQVTMVYSLLPQRPTK